MTNEEDLLLINRGLQKASAVTAAYENIMVSVSGGKDSDVMLDMLLRVCPKEKLHFVFFDTGIEYTATKSHLADIENKYGIVIEHIRATKPVPLGVRHYGLPFLSKDISSKINCLQNHNFDFANDGNKSFEELMTKYPHIKASLEWWCNVKSGHNIKDNKLLKEFMIAHPPQFKISAGCCYGAKKSPSHIYERANRFDLKCLGLRRAENGVRSTAYKNCFTPDPTSALQNFRPLWWFTNETENKYIQRYDVQLSDCYTKYGMQRTGCAGCPFGSGFEDELEIIKVHEPKIYKAANNIFSQSYDYTRAYREFKSTK